MEARPPTASRPLRSAPSGASGASLAASGCSMGASVATRLYSASRVSPGGWPSHHPPRRRTEEGVRKLPKEAGRGVRELPREETSKGRVVTLEQDSGKECRGPGLLTAPALYTPHAHEATRLPQVSR